MTNFKFKILNKNPGSVFPRPSSGYDGIALVAVLAILTVIALLASTFIISTNIQSKAGKASINTMKAQLLSQSGYQHALSLIQNDSSLKGLICDSPETDPQLFASESSKKWHLVHNEKGNIIGRYKFEIADECGKLNVNTLQSLAEHAMISNKRNGRSSRKDPFFSLLSPKAIRSLRAYQYGPNKVPGMRNVDDNKNNITLENDGLDNNFNGIIDEENEGIDEPAEYNTFSPSGDDKTIDFISEIPDIIAVNKNSPILKNFSEYLTTYSISHSKSLWLDDRQICINGANVRELSRAIRSIKDKKAISKTSQGLSRLVCNIMDFRDENHSLSTHGGSYGIEAICFNEIMANDGSHILEPHANRNYIPTGKGNSLGTKKYSAVIGCIIDPQNKNDIHDEHVFKYPMQPLVITMAGKNVRVKYDGPNKYKGSNWPDINYKELFKVLKKRGKTKNDNIIYPINFWKNGHMIFKTESNQTSFDENPDHLPKIIASDEQTVTVEPEWGPPDNKKRTYETLMQIYSNTSNRVGFWLNNHWERAWGQFTVHPQCSEWAITEIRPNTYFRVYVGNNSFTPIAFKGNSPMLDCDGNPSSYSETEEHLLKWVYKEGKPIRTDSHGFIDVIVTSSKNCNGKRPSSRINKWMDINSSIEKNNSKSIMTQNIFVRPDIVELINISDKPVSLTGWRVMVNTGSVAKELCQINSATHYSAASGGFLDDENPVISPHGYAYLTSDKQIFGLEYGSSKNNSWGDSAKEQNPCYELPQDTWGVWYKIKGFRPGSRNLWSDIQSPDANIVLEGANFNPGDIVGEMIEFRSDRSSYKGNNLNGFRRIVTGNTKDSVEVLYGGAVNADQDIRVGDYAVILGLPRNGGFLSLTLRNEYNQITSRTLEYGKTDFQDFDVSTERPDPTVFDVWKTTAKTTFGGTFREARSHNLKKIINTTVLNRPLGSYEDLLKISSGKENISYNSNKKAAADFLKTIGPALTMDMIRLDAEAEDAWIGNANSWDSTMGIVASCDKSAIAVKGKKWEADIWYNNTLTFLSGKLRGEQFKIAGNNASSLKIKGRSTGKRALLSASRGDKCSIGPPYKTPLFYTRKENRDGKWEWKNTGLNPNINYDLYLFGLNDSINTTEFLEENHNAKITVKVWNYISKKWDVPPKKRYTYDKNDSIYFGRLTKNNISDKGAVKISITPHNLNDMECSGTAWLDYIMLTPIEHPGRINVNTASKQVLAALPGVDNTVAQNIVKGISKNGKQIRPYKSIYDLLDVKGITPVLMCRIANYITTRTDVYRINVIAEILKPSCENLKAKNIPPSQILSKNMSTFLVERIPESDGKCKFKLLECTDLR